MADGILSTMVMRDEVMDAVNRAEPTIRGRDIKKIIN